MGQGIWIDSDKLDWNDEMGEVLRHGSLSVGFIGLAETLKALVGAHHGESEASQSLGIDIVRFMRERLDREAHETGLNFTLLATPVEGLSGRFVKMDEREFGTLEGMSLLESVAQLVGDELASPPDGAKRAGGRRTFGK